MFVYIYPPPPRSSTCETARVLRVRGMLSLCLHAPRNCRATQIMRLQTSIATTTANFTMPRELNDYLDGDKSEYRARILYYRYSHHSVDNRDRQVITKLYYYRRIKH